MVNKPHKYSKRSLAVSDWGGHSSSGKHSVLGNLLSDPSVNYVYVIDSLFVCYLYEIFHDNFTYLKHGIKLDFSCKLHGKKAWIMYETL